MPCGDCTPPPSSGRRAAFDLGRVVAEEDVRHELAAAAQTELREDRLQVILHGVCGHVERVRDLDRR
jgi:hypothetical protein